MNATPILIAASKYLSQYTLQSLTTAASIVFTSCQNTNYYPPDVSASIIFFSNTKFYRVAKPINCKTTRRVNWHEAAVCAIEIELRDFADILDFHSEYVLGKSDYRIDLLVIKALSAQPIPKNIAHCFKTYNLFEIKRLHSSVTVNAYYKTIGYADLLLDKLNGSQQYISLDVSVTFLSFRYPRNLIQTLRKKDGFTIEKPSLGIYYIGNKIFDIQTIIGPKFPQEENLYLRCLAGNLHNSSITNQLAEDYAKHQGGKIYNKCTYSNCQ